MRILTLFTLMLAGVLLSDVNRVGAAPIDAGKLGVYSGKAKLIFYSSEEAKPIKYNGEVTLTVFSENSVSVAFPYAPNGWAVGMNCVAILSNSGGAVYYSGDSISMTGGSSLKGTGSKASAHLNGSVTLHDNIFGYSTFVFTVKKMRKLDV